MIGNEWSCGISTPWDESAHFSGVRLTFVVGDLVLYNILLLHLTTLSLIHFAIKIRELLDCRFLTCFESWAF